jgi:hypothetical protein
MHYHEILKTIQVLLHYGLHLIFPIFIVFIFFKTSWKKVYLILLATMLVDLDHLLSTPIFDPNRCSIGNHLLHMPLAIAFYVILFLIPKTRIVGIGLLLHMFTDWQDGLWIQYLK